MDSAGRSAADPAGPSEVPPSAPSAEPTGSADGESAGKVDKGNKQSQFIKDAKRPASFDTLRDLEQGRNATRDLIDNRNGGLYVYGGSVFIQGDAVGGNSHGPRGAGPAPKKPAGRVAASSLEKFRVVFQACPAFERAFQTLRESHLTVLWGPRDTGKWAAAAYMNDRLGHAQIYQVEPTLSCERLHLLPIEERAAYIIDTLHAACATALTATHIRSLAERLREAEARLVITVDRAVSLDRSALGAHLISWDVPPPLPPTLNAHLRFYIPDVEQRASVEALLERPEVRDLLTSGLTPFQIDQWAFQLAEVAGGRATFEAVFDMLGQAAQQQTEQWFRDHPDLELRTLRVAAAALSGSRFGSVQSCAAELLNRLHRASGNSDAPPGRPLFSRTRTELLADLGAHIVPGEIQTEYGTTPAEMLELVHSASRRETLLHVWREHVEIRSCLLEWLHGIAAHPDSSARVSAAAAVGALATLDFDLVLEHVLRPWAKNPRPQIRVLCAIAFSVVISNERLAPELLRLLHHWSTLDNEELRWTTAAAYGWGVGASYPQQTVRDLLRLVGDNGDILQVVRAAFQQLLSLGHDLPEYYDVVLDGLIDAVSGNAADPTIPLFIALDLARNVLRPSAAEGADGQEPAFLWMVSARTHRKQVFLLLREALNFKPIRPIVFEVLEEWLDRAEEDFSVYQSMRTLLYLLVINGTDREVLRVIEFLSRLTASGSRPRGEQILSLLRRATSGRD